MIELLVAMSVMAVAMSIFSALVISSSRQRAINLEAALASEGARMTLEAIRNVPFEHVYAAFNDDPNDDPSGVVAPGQNFSVGNLTPLEGDSDGFAGRVVFPDIPIPPAPPGAPKTHPRELREDLSDETLGMPRDLNGDSLIDDRDHRGDYYILPVRIEVEWAGALGPRSFVVETAFTRWETFADG